MEQKRVSCKVAKAIKEAGYPQGNTYDVYAIETLNIGTSVSPEGVMLPGHFAKMVHGDFADIPSYLEVWLWLWREKKKSISIICDEDDRLEANWYVNAEKLIGGIGSFTDQVFFEDPEDAIIAAIEHLVDNGLIK